MRQYSIFDVSEWFLSKESMTPKKLQKLSYYFEAWCHALFNRSLINDTRFEAWIHGPVSPELYSIEITVGMTLNKLEITHQHLNLRR